MASVIEESNGRRRIEFFDSARRRRRVRLGKMSAKQADAFKGKIEAVVSDQIVGRAHDAELSRWLRDLEPKLAKRMQRVGLLSVGGFRASTLGAFLTQYFAALSVKSGTATAYGHVRRCLLAFFGDGKQLREIEPVDGDQFRTWLKDHEKLSDPTIARRITTARQMFKRACKWRLITENPFADVKAGSQRNKARQFFVTREAAQAVLDVCPDAQWRLLFALSRFGGLRCPSEHLGLTWDDVDWERAVASSCTARRRSITKAASRASFRFSLSCGPTCKRSGTRRLLAPCMSSRDTGCRTQTFARI
ncbi:MAG TPA: phage integrase SAM-like domain-containing protein [Tepidisphaeraceae bacterium]|nr:phage integrase SAM-like domain-containing protein [Tepidisphaeraceae bacterium]